MPPSNRPTAVTLLHSEPGSAQTHHLHAAYHDAPPHHCSPTVHTCACCPCAAHSPAPLCHRHARPFLTIAAVAAPAARPPAAAAAQGSSPAHRAKGPQGQGVAPPQAHPLGVPTALLRGGRHVLPRQGHPRAALHPPPPHCHLQAGPGPQGAAAAGDPLRRRHPLAHPLPPARAPPACLGAMVAAAPPATATAMAATGVGRLGWALQGVVPAPPYGTLPLGAGRRPQGVAAHSRAQGAQGGEAAPYHPLAGEAARPAAMTLGASQKAAVHQAAGAWAGAVGKGAQGQAGCCPPHAAAGGHRCCRAPHHRRHLLQWGCRCCQHGA
jgi:hypothetical protein